MVRLLKVKPAGARVAVIPYEPYAESVIEIQGREKYTHMSTITEVGSGCKEPWQPGMIVACKTRFDLKAMVRAPGTDRDVHALVIEEHDILASVEIDFEGMRGKSRTIEPELPAAAAGGK